MSSGASAMRLCLLIPVLTVRFAAAQTDCRLEGRVVSTTGEPVTKATVYLQNDSLQYFDTSDNEGKFLFDNITPGSYTLQARRPGFVGQYEPAPYILVAGQVVKNVVMTLPKQATISGSVVDQDGDPIGEAEVAALRWSYVGGKRLLSRSRGSTVTNDQGDFLIADLSPGRYYLLVVDHPENRPKGISSRSGPMRSYVSTFYPGELDAGSAVPLDVAVGSDVQNITIQVRSERVYSIRGKLSGLSASELHVPYDLLLAPIGDGSGRWVHVPLNVRAMPPDGAFESPRLPAGTYTLQTSSGGVGVPGADNTTRAGRAEVTILDADVEGVVVDLRPTVEISGTVKVQDGDPLHGSRLATPMELGRLWVGIEEVDLVDPAGGHMQVKDDGTFRFENLRPAQYLLNLENLAEGMYLKSARLGDRDVLHTPLNLTSGEGGVIEVLLGKNAARMSGIVLAREDNPSRDVLVTVALWPVTQESGAQLEGIKWAYAGRQREFQFQGLAPGEYYLAAWEESGPELLASPEFRVHMQREASRITMQEGSREAVEVKLLPKEEVAAEVAKLR